MIKNPSLSQLLSLCEDTPMNNPPPTHRLGRTLNNEPYYPKLYKEPLNSYIIRFEITPTEPQSQQYHPWYPTTYLNEPTPLYQQTPDGPPPPPNHTTTNHTPTPILTVKLTQWASIPAIKINNSLLSDPYYLLRCAQLRGAQPSDLLKSTLYNYPKQRNADQHLKYLQTMTHKKFPHLLNPAQPHLVPIPLLARAAEILESTKPTNPEKELTDEEKALAK